MGAWCSLFAGDFYANHAPSVLFGFWKKRTMSRKRQRKTQSIINATSNPKATTLTLIECATELLKSVADGFIMMASGIMVGVVLRQVSGHEDLTSIISIGLVLFVCSGLCRLIVKQLEVLNAQRK